MTQCSECGHQVHESITTCPECNVDITVSVEAPQNTGPALIAVGAITGEFIPSQNGSELTSRVGSTWPVSEERCFSLISVMEKKFKAKNKFHSYYEEDRLSTSPQSRLLSYIEQELTLTELATNFMADLTSAAIESGQSRRVDGHVVFMHYKTNGDEDDLGRLLVFMVGKKEGFDFDGNLVPTSTTHINIDALRQAALFDLTLFHATYPEEPEAETYLKFIKGNSSAKFFQLSFGCVARADNKRSTEQLYDALDSFQQVNGLSESFYQTARANIDRHLSSAASLKKPISAATLYQAVESALPEGSTLRNTFEAFVNNSGYEINTHIEPTSKNVEDEKWVTIHSSDQSFKAEVYKQQIGATGNGQPIEYDSTTHILSFHIVDDRTRRELERLVTPVSTEVETLSRNETELEEEGV